VDAVFRIQIFARVVFEDINSNGDTFEVISGGEFENFSCELFSVNTFSVMNISPLRIGF
jgi:hypothetical protein